MSLGGYLDPFLHGVFQFLLCFLSLLCWSTSWFYSRFQPYIHWFGSRNQNMEIFGGESCRVVAESQFCHHVESLLGL